MSNDVEDGSEHLWRSVVASLREGIVVATPDGRILSANAAAATLLGVASADLDGLADDVLDLVAQDGSPVAWADLAILSTYAADRHDGELVVGARRPDDDPRWLRLSSRRHGSGDVAVTVVTIHQTPGAQQGSAPQDRRYRAAFEGATLGLLVLDGRNRAVEANDAACAMARTDRRQLADAVLCEHLHPDDRQPVVDALVVARRGARRRETLEVRFATRNGDERIAGIDLLRVGEDAHPEADVLVQVTDLTDRRREEALLRAEADHDALTGLQNRRSFERSLAAHLHVSERYGSTGALLLVDIDHFKVVNDTFGHVAGDDVLRDVARVLHGRLRGSDVVGRLGGDEFAVLLPLAGRAGVEAVAASIVDEVRQRRAAPTGVTVSVGAAMIRAPAVAMADVFRSADRALYVAKQGGRDRWELTP